MLTMAMIRMLFLGDMNFWSKWLTLNWRVRSRRSTRLLPKFWVKLSRIWFRLNVTRWLRSRQSEEAKWRSGWLIAMSAEVGGHLIDPFHICNFLRASQKIFPSKYFCFIKLLLNSPKNFLLSPKNWICQIDESRRNLLESFKRVPKQRQSFQVV